MTPAPQKGPDLATIDPRALDMAFRVLIGVMKPKARARAVAVLQGLARDMAPDPVDLAVVRLSGYRSSPASRVQNRRLSDGFWTIAGMLR